MQKHKTFKHVAILGILLYDVDVKAIYGYIVFFSFDRKTEGVFKASDVTEARARV